MEDAFKHEIVEFFSSFSGAWKPIDLRRVSEHPGFSGSTVWKTTCLAGLGALRRWTPGCPPARVAAVHRLMSIARREGCRFVPEPIPDVHGRTHQIIREDVWELCRWMPGEPELSRQPSDQVLCAAVRALVDWHRALSPSAAGLYVESLAPATIVDAFLRGRSAASPAMQRRVAEWARLRGITTRDLDVSVDDPHQLGRRTIRLATKFSPAMSDWLRNADDPVTLRVCLRDIRAEHLLFTQSCVTGLVDFGAVGLDTPACDLGRMLGSMVPDQHDAWTEAVALYCEQSRWGTDILTLARRFDYSGTLIGALHWLEWFHMTRRRIENREAAYVRWKSLVERLEQL